ncbi:MAG: hypothetical protein Q9167_000103 [Letrouitia subvulpina]
MLSEPDYLPPLPSKGRKSSENLVHGSDLRSRNGNYNVNRPVKPGYRFQKRTASGDAKRNVSTSEKSTNPTQCKLSETSDTKLRTSQIKELSSQLQARLSYAMFKLQSGWQSHSLADFEGKTSAQISPIFASSDQRLPVTSPESYTNKGRCNLPSSINQSFEKGTAMPISSSLTSGSPNNALGLEGAHNQPKCLTSPASPGVVYGAYGSSYKPKIQNTSGQQVQSQPPLNNIPSLAPPADIWPRNSRHSHFRHEEPHRLDTDQTYRRRSLQGVSSAPAPASPSSHQAYLTRSPSQKAADEKDAVETLVLMSSPGNPGTQQSSKTPLEILPKTPIANPIHFGVGLADGQKHKTHHKTKMIDPAHLLRSGDIDRVLDEMTDESSSDDEGFAEQWDTLR